MTDTDHAARSKRLERRVRELEAREALGSEVDATLEEAIREHHSLGWLSGPLLDLLARHSGAAGAFFRSYDEDQALQDFTRGTRSSTPLEHIAAATADRPRWSSEETGGEGATITVLAEALDVAGEHFGCAGLVLEGGVDGDRRAELEGLIHVFCEELDNHLGALRVARIKANAIREISDALKAPILSDGVAEAVGLLSRFVPFDDLLLLTRQEDDVSGDSVHYRLRRSKADLELCSERSAEPELDAVLREEAIPFINGESSRLLERLGFEHYREEALIHGIRSSKVIGRIIISNAEGQFTTFDRDLLDRFADSVRQRVVDFGREWKRMTRFFPPATIRRLLQQPDYQQRFLEPRERDVAILFGDISGFTRISEQVLREPALIGRFIDKWSKRVVQIVWEEGGVFDKMVGDCVIALFGPPFFEDDARARCRAAARAAERICEYTAALADDPELPELKAAGPVGVAIGVNWAPLFVGLFGPEEDFTGFSSGMNNAARLQGQAVRDEILCMDSFVEAYEDPAAFGEERSATVKNVAEPLQFRALRRGATHPPSSD